MKVFDSNLDAKRRQKEKVYCHGLTTEMAAMMCQRFHTFSNITCSIIRKTESDTVSSIIFLWHEEIRTAHNNRAERLVCAESVFATGKERGLYS